MFGERRIQSTLLTQLLLLNTEHTAPLFRLFDAGLRPCTICWRQSSFHRHSIYTIGHGSVSCMLVVTTKHNCAHERTASPHTQRNWTPQDPFFNVFTYLLPVSVSCSGLRTYFGRFVNHFCLLQHEPILQDTFILRSNDFDFFSNVNLLSIHKASSNSQRGTAGSHSTSLLGVPCTKIA
jgi:hypothetical protein